MVNKIDCSKPFEITVKSQEELDAIPDDFKGRIYKAQHEDKGE